MATPRPAVRWYRSLYLHIGLAFAIFVIAIVVAQSAIFSTILSRSNPFPNRSPNNLAVIVAADVGSALADDSAIDLQEYLQREYGRAGHALWVVLKDGRIGGNTSAALRDSIRSEIAASLGGIDYKRTGTQPNVGVPDPIVTAPIQVKGELRGLVVMPPPGRPHSVLGSGADQLLSIPGAIIVILAAGVFAAIVFEPVRRRLEALGAATERFGAGDVEARAPEGGDDEIARLASAFNQMAHEIALRNAALETSDRLRRQMLADVSHELKTPLTAMRGYVETLHLADANLDPVTRRRYFETLERETDRLDRIVRDLLDLARMEHGVNELDVRLFAIRRVFELVARRHEVEMIRRRIGCDIYVADAVDQITADPDRLEQVIENLVANALRHTPDGGRLELYAIGNEHSVTLSVIDSGSGIPAEHVPHIFERFYKGDASRAATSSTGGSGLGLSIAKAIVERHGGRIFVTSQPGRTEFTMTLPQDVPQPRATDPQSTPTNL